MKQFEWLCMILLLIVAFVTASGNNQTGFIEFNTWSETRKELTIAYQKQHYGLDTCKLTDPQMVVVHYTAINGTKNCLNYFKSPYLSQDRKNITHGGRLNVGVHFVVARDGTIYSLLPEDVVGRHAIGFNYTSFGIENVAANANYLTKAQVDANVILVKYLTIKYPSIKYLIGHYEYTKKNYPHYLLYRELDPKYKFTSKIDPGKKFMKQLRDQLKNKYNIELLK